ncbi:hypothetical protein DRJ25_06140, partial [Candidatus Woesearchaeota archaeon]
MQVLGGIKIAHGPLPGKYPGKFGAARAVGVLFRSVHICESLRKHGGVCTQFVMRKLQKITSRA